MAKRILLVEDSASVRQVASIALRGAGYETIEACNGQEALATPGREKVNPIISDVNMPVMDGITFLKEVKGRAAGARAWISKPFKPQVMVDAVAKLLLA